MRDWKRYEVLKGRRLKDQNLLIEARDLAGAKRSDRLPWTLGQENELVTEALHARAL